MTIFKEKKGQRKKANHKSYKLHNESNLKQNILERSLTRNCCPLNSGFFGSFCIRIGRLQQFFTRRFTTEFFLGTQQKSHLSILAPSHWHSFGTLILWHIFGTRIFDTVLAPAPMTQFWHPHLWHSFGNRTLDMVLAHGKNLYTVLPRLDCSS